MAYGKFEAKIRQKLKHAKCPLCGSRDVTCFTPVEGRISDARLKYLVDKGMVHITPGMRIVVDLICGDCRNRWMSAEAQKEWGFYDAWTKRGGSKEPLFCNSCHGQPPRKYIRWHDRLGLICLKCVAALRKSGDYLG
jgi:hypothetical protein